MLGLHTFYTRLKQRLEMRTRVQRHPKNGLLCQRIYGGGGIPAGLLRVHSGKIEVELAVQRRVFS